MTSQEKQYDRLLLELCEDEEFDEFKRKVEDELGLMFRGYVLVRVQEQDEVGGLKGFNFPQKQLVGGMYVVCHRLANEEEKLNDLTPSLQGLSEGYRWRGSGGDQANRRGRASEDPGMGYYRFECKRGSESPLWVAHVACLTRTPRRVRCFLVKVRCAFQHIQTEALDRLPTLLEEFEVPSHKRQREDDSDAVRSGGIELTAVGKSYAGRILFVQCFHDDEEPINIKREIEEIEKVCHPQKMSPWKCSLFRLKFEQTSNPSLAHLKAVLEKSVETEEFFDYIHFSGHGYESPFCTLAFAQDDGKLLASDHRFASLFARYQMDAEKHDHKLKGVFLNCCHGERQARTLCDHARVPVCVYHEGQVTDAIAIKCSAATWKGVAEGEKFESAFKLAKGALDAHGFKLAKPKDTTEEYEKAKQLYTFENKISEKHRRKVDEYYEADEEKDAMETPHSTSFSLRKYQEELLVACTDHNAVVCLPTGAGKSAVAFTFMKEISVSKANWGRKVVFLTSTVPLMFQQARAFHRFCPSIPIEQIGKYCGDGSQLLRQNFATKRFAFFTGGLFLDLLESRQIALSDFCGIVFDEAHHCKGRHCYRRIMVEYYFTMEEIDLRPRIVGLSATPAEGSDLASNKASIKDVCKDLGNSVLAVPISSEAKEELEEIVRDPPLETIVVQKSRDDSYFEKLVGRYLDDKLLPFIQKYGPTIEEALTHKAGDRDDMQTWIEALPKLKNWLSSSAENETTTKWLLERVVSTIEEFHERSDSGDRVLRTMQKSLADLLNGPMPSDPADILGDFLSSMKQVGVIDGLLKFRTTIVEELRSSKFVRLMETLLREVGRYEAGDRIIVFVKTQETCKNVSDLVDFFLADRTCDFVVGHSSAGDSNSMCGMSASEQRMKCERFASGETTILVATSVLEEGIDVGQCRLVIRYDDAATATAFRQSRGRARDKRGKVILMTKDEGSVEKFKDKELQMREAICAVASTEEKGEAKNEESVRKFLEEDATDLLVKYCTQVLQRQPDIETQNWARGKNTYYTASVNLPGLGRAFNCSRPRAKKEQARDEAAYKACVHLNNDGKLDDFLPGSVYYQRICFRKPQRRESVESASTFSSYEDLGHILHETAKQGDPNEEPSSP